MISTIENENSLITKDLRLVLSFTKLAWVGYRLKHSWKIFNAAAKARAYYMSFKVFISERYTSLSI